MEILLTPSIKVSSDNWVSHFSKLFSVKNQFKAQNKHYEQLLLEAEKNKTFTQLDFKITEKEVVQAISKLKNKKSSGLDGIKNEMLKTGQIYLVPCIVKLSNTILSSGTYPSDWKIGYI